MNLNKLQETEEGRGACHAAVHVTCCNMDYPWERFTRPPVGLLDKLPCERSQSTLYCVLYASIHMKGLEQGNLQRQK